MTGWNDTPLDEPAAPQVDAAEADTVTLAIDSFGVDAFECYLDEAHYRIEHDGTAVPAEVADTLRDKALLSGVVLIVKG